MIFVHEKCFYKFQSETVDCVKLKICERLGEPRLHPSMLRIIYGKFIMAEAGLTVKITILARN